MHVLRAAGEWRFWLASMFINGLELVLPCIELNEHLVIIQETSTIYIVALF